MSLAIKYPLSYNQFMVIRFFIRNDNMKIAICDDITEYRLSIKAFANEYFKIHNIEYIIDDFKMERTY